MWAPSKVYWNMKISKMTPEDTSSGQGRHVSQNRNVPNQLSR